jgi:hypothetical protein
MSLNILISAEYKITSDSLNVIVNRKYIVDPTKSPNWPARQAKGADPTPREEWREVAWCPTVDKAVGWIMQRSIRDSDAESLSEIVEMITSFRREITAKLT